MATVGVKRLNVQTSKSRQTEGILIGTERLRRKIFVKEMRFKSDVKGRGSDRW